MGTIIKSIFLGCMTVTLSLLTSCTDKVKESTPSQPALSFKDGKFRIAQFTDLHIMPGDSTTDTTENTIRAIVASEKPDLAILTGDIITYDPATEGWERLCDLFEELNLPFTVQMGNHDDEYLEPDSIFTIVMKSPMYVGDKGPEDIYGCGNTAIEVKGNNGNTAAVLYCIDSNGYQKDKNLGEYDWIHPDQIEWYNHTSQKYTDANGGKPLPSMMFFHIPLYEYNDIIGDDKTFGLTYEGEGVPSGINSGMLASLVENKDVMGVFAGHYHGVDYVGMLYDVALGFGRCTGAQAQCRSERGARIIDLEEGERRFSTYVMTPGSNEGTWYYPSGLNSIDMNNMEYFKATETAGTENGVNFTYYEGPIKHSSQIKPEMMKSKGATSNFDISQAPAEDHFAYIFDSYIDIPERGVYRFYTLSDDGTVLYIDGQKVVDNDGGHSARRREGKVALEKGLHRLKLDYYEDYMGQQLEVGWSSIDIPESVIPDSVLYRIE